MNALLDELKEADPHSLRDWCRASWHSIRSIRKSWQHCHRQGDARMAKKVMIGLAAAAAMLLAVFAYDGLAARGPAEPRAQSGPRNGIRRSR